MGNGTDGRAATTATGPAWRRARRLPAPWVIGAVGLAALGAGQLVPVRHHIESDLSSRGQAALRAEGLTGVTVHFTGRDGRLTGSVASPADAERALTTVRHLDGVRVATSALTYAASSAPTPTPAPAPATSPPPTPPTSASTTPSSSADDALAIQRALDALAQIGFPFGSSTTTDSGRAAVRHAAELLRVTPEIRVRVEGYTDDVGSWGVNKALSLARAQFVRTLLIEDGIAPDRLTVFGWSKEDPKVPNTSAANRAINRRVQFRVLG